MKSNPNLRRIWRYALWIARGASARHQRLAAASALGLLLGISGCSVSHTQHVNVDNDGDGFLVGDDCNDNDAEIHPDAEEGICPDGIDQDCDGVDGDPEAAATARCRPPNDADGDGYPAGEDCDDSDPDVHPGASESICCESRDMNCDGVIGPGPDSPPIACNCFYDADGDGWGDGFGPGPDCDDTDPDINPGAVEVCGDDVDNDCDGNIDYDDDDCLIINGMLDIDDLDGSFEEGNVSWERA